MLHEWMCYSFFFLTLIFHSLFDAIFLLVFLCTCIDIQMVSIKWELLRYNRPIFHIGFSVLDLVFPPFSLNVELRRLVIRIAHSAADFLFGNALWFPLNFGDTHTSVWIYTDIWAESLPPAKMSIRFKPILRQTKSATMKGYYIFIYIFS